MTDPIREALEALETCTPGDYSTGHVIHPSYDENAVEAAITALRAHLDAPAPDAFSAPITAAPTCTDERPCVNCFAGVRWRCLGPAAPAAQPVAEAVDAAFNLAWSLGWNQREGELNGEHSTELKRKAREKFKAILSHPAPPERKPLSVAAEAVLAERRRQVEAEGWTATHDDKHGDGSMALAAACYACNAASWAQRASSIPAADYAKYATPGFRWPWAMKWWKPKSQRHDLVRAGALILAEIERLDRKESK